MKLNPESFSVSDRLAHVVRIPRSPVLSLIDDGENRQLEFPCSVSGVILASKEADSFQFVGTKGQKLTFLVGAQSMYSLLDPVVRIRNKQRELLKEADDISRTNQDCEVQVTLPTDGVYNVEVTDRYDSGGPRHFYVLTCAETSAEISATVAATNFTVDPVEDLDVPVTISRTNNYADAVTLSVQGLPEGVSAETVVSESKGDTAKQVTLKIRQSANVKAFSGLVSIVGHGDGGHFRATASIPNSKETVDSIWLTIIPPAAIDAEVAASTDKE